LIFDTCHSGQAVNDLAKELISILSLQATSKQFSFAVLASAHSLEKAKENLFLAALHESLLRPDLSAAERGWSDNDEFIKPDDLSDACIRLMPGNYSNPQCLTFGSQKQIVPNPRFRGSLPSENVEERAWRLSTSDAALPFNLAARGIEV